MCVQRFIYIKVDFLQDSPMWEQIYATCHDLQYTLTCSTIKNTIRETVDLAFILSERQPVDDNIGDIFVTPYILVTHKFYSSFTKYRSYCIANGFQYNKEPVKQFSEI